MSDKPVEITAAAKAKIRAELFQFRAALPEIVSLQMCAFTQYLAEGFTEKQALYLTAELIRQGGDQP